MLRADLLRVLSARPAARDFAACTMIIGCVLSAASVMGQSPQPMSFEHLSHSYQQVQKPLLQQFCMDCHSTAEMQGELDLERFASLDDVRTQPQVWQKVAEMLDNGEMPPKDAAQPSQEQRRELRTWLQHYLDAESLASAGDPGPVVLRRLNNAEYTYSIQDLTAVPLTPASEFPVDSASGEGFTNTGSALVMSPALLTKYLDAAREIARHAVLLPDGFRFSRWTTRRDWTNETLHQIRQFYGRYSDSTAGDQVNLQGVIFQTNGGGRLPLERYLTFLLQHREALRRGDLTFEQVADLANTHPSDDTTLANTADPGADGLHTTAPPAPPQLSARYLRTLWTALEFDHAKAPPGEAAILLNPLRAAWQQATAESDLQALLQQVAQWQDALWRFTTVGHIGKVNGPRSWLEPVNPVAERQEIRLPLTPLADIARQGAPDSAERDTVTLYLVAGDAGSPSDDDVVVWERPRLVAAGRPDVLLRDVRDVTRQLTARREQLFANTQRCLAAAAKLRSQPDGQDVAKLATEFSVDVHSLAAWLNSLGIGETGPVARGPLLSRPMHSVAGYDFISGWAEDDALSILANSSDQHVRIPGNMAPHSIAVHPAPALSVVVGWQSPVSASLDISGTVRHAHPECGNGTAWTLELRRGHTRERLASGISHGDTPVSVGLLTGVSVRPGETICLIISPRDGNHSCDLTSIDLTLTDTAADTAARQWNLARDLSPDLLAGNPHADQYGNADVWSFFAEPASGDSSVQTIPAGSLLARWQSTADPDTQAMLASQLQQLLQTGPAGLQDDAPDARLYQQLNSLNGPLLASALQARGAEQPPAADSPASPADASAWGLTASQFGLHPPSDTRDDAVPHVESASLCVRAPAIIEVRLPADLVTGAEFVTTGTLHPVSGREGSVQMQILTTRPAAISGIQPTSVTSGARVGPWTSGQTEASFATPVIVSDGSQAGQRLLADFDEFRQLFPAALCYTRIVPVDEVVTLTLYYREDEHLQRLLLSPRETEELNRLWDQLHYISRDALAVVDAYEQLMEFATQDADPSVFEPMRAPLNRAAAEFRQTLENSEPSHVRSLLEFAALAFRRVLQPGEADQLRTLYARLRTDGLAHEEAFTVVLQRILISPSFLYRLETPPAGTAAAPVDDWELASRLSYFLWSSVPDAPLRAAAASGTLGHPDVLWAQTQRMMQDPKIRRLATECFCQWLHIYDFAELDEKSEQVFPTFEAVKPLLYEEAILTFSDLLQRDGSVLELFDADHTFLNAALAEHYGIEGVLGDQWRRVERVRQHSRGGILGLGATLAKQSGASRTSPILRGNWLSEVVLGEKLPRPPSGVPPLPESASAELLSVRQLVERHTSDDRCSGCHQRIDPYGFSLEGFDAIGRFRTADAEGRPIDTRTTMPDGTAIDGFEDLKHYLLTTRRDAVVRQVCRKLLGYALGRAVQLSDQPLLQEIQSQLQTHNYRISVAIQAIVNSPQFREIRGRDAARTVAAD